MQFQKIFSLLLSSTLALASPTPDVEERAPTACFPVGITPPGAAAVVAAFRSSRLVPDLVPSIFPRLEVNVDYNGKEVLLGNKFTTLETATEPDISFSAEFGRDPAKTKYAIFLVDPDVPSRQGAAGIRVEYLHLAIHDAQASCIKNQDPKTDVFYQTLTPASTTQHRYTFLVYRQPPGYKPDTIFLNTRTPFDMSAYAKRKGLELVGGNFLREAITNT